MRSVVISIDAELAWGFHDLPNPPTERISSARKSWWYLIDLLEQTRIPATWAVVGHLFLDGCDGTHPNHPLSGSWFEQDPGGESHAESVWFGRDLIERVAESEVSHEIGSHSFSHVEFGRPETTRAVAEAEVEHAVELASRNGVGLESCVFPRNRVGHRRVLADNGFRCYRGVSPKRWYDGLVIRPFGKLLDHSLGMTHPPIVEPYTDEYGLVNVPPSIHLYTFEGAPRSVVETVFDAPIVRQTRLGLDALRERDRGVFHLWLHPNDITGSEDRRRMESIAELLVEYRQRYGIEIRTMADVARRWSR